MVPRIKLSMKLTTVSHPLSQLVCFAVATYTCCELLAIVNAEQSQQAVGASADHSARLNILLVTADDLGPQLSCYGDPIAKTPNIDALANQSVQFQTAYVSQASCSPSRSTMLTGLYPHANGHYGLANANVGFQVHPELYPALLPNVLKRAGYRTGIIGKLHVNPENEFQLDLHERTGFGSRQVKTQLDFARDFVNQSGDRPWFLMFNLFDPHVARKRLPNGDRGPQFFPDQVDGLPAAPLSAEDVPPWPWQQVDSAAQRTKIAGYYNCVHRIDAAIGMLTALLHETKHWDDTLILFLGDHGPPFARGKTSCYEPGLRVPFIVRWPGVSKSHRSAKLVSSVDIYPTILDAAEIKVPEELHGRSLRPVLVDSKSTPWRQTMAAEFHYHGHSPFFPRRAITDGRFKLIHNLRAGELAASPSVDGDRAHILARQLRSDHPARRAMERLNKPPAWELYDLEEDPNEFVNLAGDVQWQNIANRLKTALREWQRQTNDKFSDEDFRRQIEQKYRNTLN